MGLSRPLQGELWIVCCLGWGWGGEWITRVKEGQLVGCLREGLSVEWQQLKQQQAVCGWLAEAGIATQVAAGIGVPCLDELCC